MRRIFFAAVVLLSVILAVGAVWAEKAQDTDKCGWKELVSDVIGHYPLKTGTDPIDTGKAPEKGKLSLPKNWEFDLSVQRYMMSHTSYEFGNPEEPRQNPLSRLEFPLNTWWMNLGLRRTCPRWSLGVKAGMSVATNIVGKMQDSDWEDAGNTAMKTTYSESYCRALENYMFRGDVDVNISDWLRLPPSLEIRPLFAFQYQRHDLMAYNGMQWSVG